MANKKKEGFVGINNSTTWILFAGGLGTAFFLLFTDIGRDILDKLGFFKGEGRPTLANLIGESPYSFYPYTPQNDESSIIPTSPLSQTPDYITNPNPYFLEGQPYEYTGGGPYPYAHPAAAGELARPPPDYTFEENPIVEWLGKLFNG